MRSSRSKQLWLIQPGFPVTAGLPVDATRGDSVRFSPAWDLLCLQAFIVKRTGHTCDLLDLRLADDLTGGLQPIVEKISPGRRDMAVIHASFDTLGPVGEVIAHLHEHAPHVDIALCGPLVTAFPGVVNALPHVQFGLAGDAEIILRNLLDFIDIEHRLKHITGLQMRGQPVKPPHWLPELNALSLPDWRETRWSPYQQGPGTAGMRLEARLTRGHPDTAFDRVYQPPGEPLRWWNLTAMAQLLQKCPGHGIREVFFADSPGIWNEHLLSTWCHALLEARNTQRWSFHMLPAMLSEAVLGDLAYNGCFRIELLIPSCLPNRQAEWGASLAPNEIKKLLSHMHQHGIEGQLRYWAGGPGETSGEADRIFHHLKNSGFPAFSVYPFPWRPDAESSAHGAALPGEWINWAENPRQTPPNPGWMPGNQRESSQYVLRAIQHKMTRNPLVKFQRMLHRRFGFEIAWPKTGWSRWLHRRPS